MPCETVVSSRVQAVPFASKHSNLYPHARWSLRQQVETIGERLEGLHTLAV